MNTAWIIEQYLLLALRGQHMNYTLFMFGTFTCPPDLFMKADAREQRTDRTSVGVLGQGR